MNDDRTRLARAGLLRHCEPAAPGVGALVKRLGPVAAWEAVRYRGRVDGIGDLWFRETSSRTRGRTPDELSFAAELDLIEADRHGARLVIPEDDEWPAQADLDLTHVERIADRPQHGPLALYVRGARLPDLPSMGIAVVGSRDGTSYGLDVAARWSHDLAAAGFTVLSGAANGIDAAAHRGALAAAEADVPTIAVLAGGVDRPTPAANAVLIDRIIDHGAVISEYPPGDRPFRARFLVRNRLIAGLARAVLVVEAGSRSGSMSTAAAGRSLNRISLAVPGPVTSKVSVGCHHLMREYGTQLVTSSADVLAALRPTDYQLDLLAPAVEEVGSPAARVRDALSARLGRSPLEIASATGLTSSAVWEELTMLSLTGRAERRGQGWIRTGSS